jgi:hypothetical protein
MSRRKGAAGEREAAAALNEMLGTRFHRGRQYHGGPDSPDLAGDLPGLHIEVKRCEALALYPALAQARRDAPGLAVPAVMHRRNGKPWVIIVEVCDLIRLLDVVDAHRARMASEQLPVNGELLVGQTVGSEQSGMEAGHGVSQVRASGGGGGGALSQRAL